jgi:hypothetical protein
MMVLRKPKTGVLVFSSVMGFLTLTIALLCAILFAIKLGFFVYG